MPHHLSVASFYKVCQQIGSCIIHLFCGYAYARGPWRIRKMHYSFWGIIAKWGSQKSFTFSNTVFGPMFHCVKNQKGMGSRRDSLWIVVNSTYFRRQNISNWTIRNRFFQLCKKACGLDKWISNKPTFIWGSHEHYTPLCVSMLGTKSSSFRLHVLVSINSLSCGCR